MPKPQSTYIGTTFKAKVYTIWAHGPFGLRGAIGALILRIGFWGPFIL